MEFTQPLSHPLGHPQMLTITWCLIRVNLFIYLFGANKRKNVVQMIILFECIDQWKDLFLLATTKSLKISKIFFIKFATLRFYLISNEVGRKRKKFRERKQKRSCFRAGLPEECNCRFVHWTLIQKTSYLSITLWLFIVSGFKVLVKKSQCLV